MQEGRDAFASRLGRHWPTDRPELFLTILDCFCLAAITGRAFPADRIRDIVWPRSFRDTYSSTWQHAPYAIADPGRYIYELIDVLCNISRVCQQEVRHYSSFRLIGKGIFQGQRSSGSRWETLYAYCGGKIVQKDGTAIPCGREPLYAGRHAWCGGCGRLICDECDYCERGCPERRAREQAIDE